MVIPKWLSFLIQEKDLKVIEAKVAAIERQCDVEIVPIIVRQSSGYPQTQLILNLCLLVFTLASYCLFSFNQTLHWNEGLTYPLQLALTGFVFLLLFLSGRQLVKNPWIQRLLNSSEVQSESCFNRAELEFYKEKIQDTKKQNGILVFISLLEHRVIILSDTKIQERFSNNELWDKAVSVITTSMSKRQLAEGLYQALELIENELKEKIPLTGNKDNLLSNKLVIKD